MLLNRSLIIVRVGVKPTPTLYIVCLCRGGVYPRPQKLYASVRFAWFVVGQNILFCLLSKQHRYLVNDGFGATIILTLISLCPRLKGGLF